MIKSGLSSVTERRSEIKTQIDQNNNDSESWGDRVEDKNKSDYRCCFQNINGLGFNKDDPKRESIRQFINEYHIDFYLMAEINVNWRIVSNNRSIHDMTKGWFETQKVKTSFNRHCRTCHKHQPGGTAIITRDQPALHFDSSGEDSRYLGRWSWQRFRGKQGQHLRVLSVYFPTKSYLYGNKKVYDQQHKALLSMGITSEVHKTFWKDFWTEVDEWLLLGDKLINVISYRRFQVNLKWNHHQPIIAPNDTPSTKYLLHRASRSLRQVISHLVRVLETTDLYGSTLPYKVEWVANSRNCFRFHRED